MTNYYKTLGVGFNATDQEIKDAYRELARKYHPDNFAGSPLEDVASEKMKEVNEAFDGIMDERRGGNGTKRANSQQGQASAYPDIREMIRNNRLVDAEEVLDGVPVLSRTAEWYFLKGSIFYSRGWYEDATKSFQTAVNMDPNNTEFSAALGRMNWQRKGNTGGYANGAYRTPANNAGGCSVCDMCSTLICADCCCECLGGDLIGCC